MTTFSPDDLRLIEIALRGHAAEHLRAARTICLDWYGLEMPSQEQITIAEHQRGAQLCAELAERVQAAADALDGEL